MTTSTKILIAAALAFVAGFVVARSLPPAAEPPVETEPAVEEPGEGLAWEMLGDSAVRLTVTSPTAAYLVAGMPWERAPKVGEAKAEPAAAPPPWPDYRVGSGVYPVPFKVFKLSTGSLFCGPECMPCIAGGCINPPRPQGIDEVKPDKEVETDKEVEPDKEAQPDHEVETELGVLVAQVQ